MSLRNRVILAVLWALSLVAVARLKTEAQVTQIGTEVRFLQGEAKGGTHSGILMIDGTPSRLIDIL